MVSLWASRIGGKSSAKGGSVSFGRAEESHLPDKDARHASQETLTPPLAELVTLKRVLILRRIIL